MKFTNKKLLAAAVLAAVTAQANAATVTYAVTASNVTMDVQFGGNWLGTGATPGTSSSDAAVAPYNAPAPYNTRGFNISGTVEFDDATGEVLNQSLVFDGGLAIDTGLGGWYIGFQNASGSYVANEGLTLNSGYFDATAGGANPGDLADLSTDNLDFTKGGVVNAAPAFVNPGFVIDQGGALDGSPITITMPGFDTGFGLGENATGSLVLFGFAAETYMGGDLTLEVAAVPVPAAAWLFGSAIVGLAGIGRKRKAA